MRRIFGAGVVFLYLVEISLHIRAFGRVHVHDGINVGIHGFLHQRCVEVAGFHNDQAQMASSAPRPWPPLFSNYIPDLIPLRSIKRLSRVLFSFEWVEVIHAR
jgi:hypothetical protein